VGSGNFVRLADPRMTSDMLSRAFIGQPHDDPTALRILDLPKGGGSARVKRRLRLRLPRGTDIKNVHALGSAHRLIVWSDQHLMVLEDW
jgi:hypothetical protein